jgi:hypothetical protein
MRVRARNSAHSEEQDRARALALSKLQLLHAQYCCCSCMLSCRARPRALLNTSHRMPLLTPSTSR